MFQVNHSLLMFSSLSSLLSQLLWAVESVYFFIFNKGSVNDSFFFNAVSHLKFLWKGNMFLSFNFSTCFSFLLFSDVRSVESMLLSEDLGSASVLPGYLALAKLLHLSGPVPRLGTLLHCLQVPFDHVPLGFVCFMFSLLLCASQLLFLLFN